MTMQIIKIKRFIIALFAVVCVASLYSYLAKPVISKNDVNKALMFAKENNMNTSFIMFCDFSIHSGKERFSIYDIKKQKVILSSLCAQGKGIDNDTHQPFSNKSGSYCSSLGFYKVGSYHKMKIGTGSFILYGLSESNSNALKRGILVHPYFTVCDIPVYPLHTSRKASKGCFVVSPIKFHFIKKFLRNNHGKPILLYAYQSK